MPVRIKSAGSNPPPADPDGAARINTLSVALYTEIPRETVRRKVGLLVKNGWLDCDALGNLSPTAQAASDLAKGTAATLAYLETLKRGDHA